MESEPPNIIDYARPPRSRKPWIILIILACLLSISGILNTQRIPLQRWWHLVQLRNQVLTYTLPPGTVLFHEKATDTAQSVLQSVRPVPLGFTVKDAMRGRLYPSERSSPGDLWTVFLHERWTPTGKPRVVLVTANVSTFPEAAYFTIAVQLFDAGSFRHPKFTILPIHPVPGLRTSGEIPGYTGILVNIAIIPYGSDFQLLPGRPDPADPSAFLFDLRQANNTTTIRGRISDDNSISLTQSNDRPLPFKIAPATKPAN